MSDKPDPFAAVRTFDRVKIGGVEIPAAEAKIKCAPTVARWGGAPIRFTVTLGAEDWGKLPAAIARALADIPDETA